MGKLLKHEFKATARVIVFVFAASLLALLLCFIGFKTEIKGLIVTSTIVVIIGMIASLLMSFIVVIQRFHNSMFGAEGYLTQTLPVSSTKLVLSKIIPSFVWVLLGYITSFFILFSFLGIVGAFSIDGKEFFSQIIKAAGLNSTLVLQAVILTATAFFINILFFVVTVMLSITIAHLPIFQKHQGLIGFVSYIIIYGIISTIETVLVMFFPLGIKVSESGLSLVTEGTGINFMTDKVNTLVIGLGSVIFEAAAIIALIFVISYLVKSKTSVRG